MSIFSVDTGSTWELYSSRQEAEAAAERCVAFYREERHPMGDLSPQQLIRQGAARYWFVPGDGDRYSREAQPLAPGRGQEHCRRIQRACARWERERQFAWDTF